MRTELNRITLTPEPTKGKFAFPRQGTLKDILDREIVFTAVATRVTAVPNGLMTTGRKT
jgi:hypothetical protein